MAEGWIKMRASLLRHPKVLAMARHLETSRPFMDWMTDPVRRSCDESVTEHVTFDVVTRVTVASLLLVWSSVNDALPEDSDTVKGIDEYCIDAMAGVPGFGAAMMAAGWATESVVGVTFRNFREYNTPAKERSVKTGAERTREYRERKRKTCDETVTRRDVTVTESREEKIREESKDIHTAAPECAVSTTEMAAVADSWNMLGGPFPKCAKVSTKRRTALKSRLADDWWRENWRAGMERVRGSPFCRGETGGTWVATFEWFIKPDSLTKVMEGTYDARGSSGSEAGNAHRASPAEVRQRGNVEAVAGFLRRAQLREGNAGADGAQADGGLHGGAIDSVARRPERLQADDHQSGRPDDLRQ